MGNNQMKRLAVVSLLMIGFVASDASAECERVWRDGQWMNHCRRQNRETHHYQFDQNEIYYNRQRGYRDYDYRGSYEYRQHNYWWRNSRRDWNRD